MKQVAPMTTIRHVMITPALTCPDDILLWLLKDKGHTVECKYKLRKLRKFFYPSAASSLKIQRGFERVPSLFNWFACMYVSVLIQARPTEEQDCTKRCISLPRFGPPPAIIVGNAKTFFVGVKVVLRVTRKSIATLSDVSHVQASQRSGAAASIKELEE